MCHVVDVDGIYYHCKHCYSGTSPVRSNSVQNGREKKVAFHRNDEIYGKRGQATQALQGWFTLSVNVFISGTFQQKLRTTLNSFTEP